MSGGYTVRQAKREDMAGLLKLDQAEGWNTVIEHLHFQFDTFQEGMFVAESLEGEIISHCASLTLDDSNGFIAFYVTKKSCRGQGIGRKEFDLSFTALGNRNIGLNASWDKKEMYISGSFKVSTFTLITYVIPIKNLKLSNRQAETEGYTILDTKDIGIEKILAYDEIIHPMPCEKVVRWILGFAHIGRVVMENDKVKGWGTLYKAAKGYRLMPLYGDSPEVAEALVHDLLKQVEGESELKIELCFPEDNSAAKKLYEDIGSLNGEFGCSKNKRLFTQRDIPVPTQLVYSILNYDNGLC